MLQTPSDSMVQTSGNKAVQRPGGSMAQTLGNDVVQTPNDSMVQSRSSLVAHGHFVYMSCISVYEACQQSDLRGSLKTAMSPRL